MSKFQSLLRQGLSEPGFCGGLVWGLEKIVGSGGFSAWFVGIISNYKKIGYGIGVLWRTAHLMVSPVAVGVFAFLFGCEPLGRLRAL